MIGVLIGIGFAIGFGLGHLSGHRRARRQYWHGLVIGEHWGRLRERRKQR